MPTRILLYLLVRDKHCGSIRCETVAHIVEFALVVAEVHRICAECRCLIVLAVGVCLTRLQSHAVLAYDIAVLANTEYHDTA